MSGNPDNVIPLGEPDLPGGAAWAAESGTARDPVSTTPTSRDQNVAGTCRKEVSKPAAEIQIRRVQEFFSGPSGKKNYDNLVHFAEWESHRFAWLVGWTSGGAADLAHEAIVRCVTLKPDGTCQRNFGPHVPVDVALRTVITSVANHVYGAGEIRRRVTEYWDERIWSEPSALVIPDVEENMTGMDGMRRLDALLESSAGDQVVRGIIVLLKTEGLFKPVSLIARRLGVAESAVFNARKRLRRLIVRLDAQRTA